MSSSTQMVFFEKPHVLYVDQSNTVKAPKCKTINKLMRSLKINGPLVAFGKMGPSAYHEPPFKLKDKVGNAKVYGWRPCSSKEYAAATDVILVGARKTESNAHVYFTLAKDVTRDKGSLIRGFQPLDLYAEVYVMSYENFLKRSLVNLRPICPHGQWLFSVSVNSILDGGEIEKKCKEVGQQIFDQYKQAARGNSEAGRSAVIRICEAAKVLTPDGVVRKTHIEYAWNGVGDTNWRWQC